MPRACERRGGQTWAQAQGGKALGLATLFDALAHRHTTLAGSSSSSPPSAYEPRLRCFRQQRESELREERVRRDEEEDEWREALLDEDEESLECVGICVGILCTRFPK